MGWRRASVQPTLGASPRADTLMDSHSTPNAPGHPSSPTKGRVDSAVHPRPATAAFASMPIEGEDVQTQ